MKLADDTNAGLIVVGCILAGVTLIFLTFLIVEARHHEQGPPKHRHTHPRYGINETCDLETCAPKGAFDE
jgi:hypothetical protein